MKHHYFNFRQLTINFSGRQTLHRHDSIISLYANSIYSKAPSTRHMLANVNLGNNNSSVTLVDSICPSYMMSKTTLPTYHYKSTTYPPNSQSSGIGNQENVILYTVYRKMVVDCRLLKLMNLGCPLKGNGS